MFYKILVFRLLFQIPNILRKKYFVQRGIIVEEI